MRLFSWLLCFFFLYSMTSILAGCGGQDDAAPPGAAAQAGGIARSDGQDVHGGRPAPPPAPVSVVAAVQGPIASYYRSTASLEAEKQADILARATGIVAAVLAEEGDTVLEGQPLLRIENDEYGYRVEQAAARTQQVAAAFERLRQMRVENLASQQEFESVRAELASAEAEEGLTRLHYSYTTVTAPFAGVVTRRVVDPGQNVSIGTPLYALAGVTPLLARVHVPSREFRQLRIDQQVLLVLDSSRDHLFGRIALISPVIDPGSGTIKVTVEVPRYPPGTRPGDFAEVRIVTELREQAVLVPRIAVVTEKGETAIYAVREGDEPRAERRLVAVGFSENDLTQILEGLIPGERVVVKGQRSLQDGQLLKILEEN